MKPMRIKGGGDGGSERGASAAARALFAVFLAGIGIIVVWMASHAMGGFREMVRLVVIRCLFRLMLHLPPSHLSETEVPSITPGTAAPTLIPLNRTFNATFKAHLSRVPPGTTRKMFWPIHHFGCREAGLAIVKFKPSVDFDFVHHFVLMRSKRTYEACEWSGTSSFVYAWARPGAESIKVPKRSREWFEHTLAPFSTSCG